MIIVSSWVLVASIFAHTGGTKKIKKLINVKASKQTKREREKNRTLHFQNRRN